MSTGKRVSILLLIFLAGTSMFLQVFAQETGEPAAIPDYLHDGGLQDELSLSVPDVNDGAKAGTEASPTPGGEQVFPEPVPAATVLGREEQSRQVIIYTAAAVLIIVLAVLAVLLIKRFRYYRAANNDTAAENACLIDLNGVTSRNSYILGTRPVMLGRVAGRDSDHLDYIVIPQTTIGRRHALIEYKDYAYWIIDQGSINGTFVNDIPVSSEVRLKHGDRVRLHKTEFDFVLPDLDGSSMTEISKTVLAGQSPVAPDTAVQKDREKVHSSSNGFELELDLYAEGDARNRVSSPSSDDDATLMPDEVPVSDDDPDGESDDATLMPDEIPVSDDDPDGESDDETLLPGQERNGDRDKP